MRGSVKKRGSVWYGIYPEQRGGKQKWRSFPGITTKRKAESKLNAIIRSLNDGTYVSESGLEFGDFMNDYYLPYAKSRSCAKTFERWSEIVTLRLTPAFGKLKLSAMNPAGIQKTYGQWLESGRKGKSLSAQTVVHYHRLLYRSMKYAKRMGFVARNVVEDVEPPKIVRREMTALDEAQTVRLLDRFRGTKLEYPVTLAVYSGLRRGEVCGLRWKDVDFDNDRIAVRQSVEETKAGVGFKRPKTASGIRTIGLPREIMDLLSKHRNQQAVLKTSLGSAWKNTDLVFPDPEMGDGSIWRPDAFGKAFAWLVRTADIPRIRLHDLRHTNASLLLKIGVFDKTVSGRLGHATSAFTKDVYGHVIGGMDGEAADALHKALEKARAAVSKPLASGPETVPTG
jgi:integrase